MNNAADHVATAIAQLPQTLQELSAAAFERLGDCPKLGENDLAALLRLLAYSEFAGNTLRREHDWFFDSLQSGSIERRQLGDQLEVFTRQLRDDGGGIEQRLRQFRNRQLLAILWRDAVAQTSLTETLGDLSSLADTLIKVSTAAALRELQQRFGDVRDDSGTLSHFVVLAMGKLGGHELNFSSDVDLIFIYTADGTTDGKRALSAQEYFGRLSRRLVALLEQVTPDGFVYRVDTRLRPFGESGPPVVSFAALESYLLQHGRNWERYAFVKARVIVGDAASARELMQSMINPFVYRRYLDYGVFESLRQMKGLIEVEVVQRELAANIKLGPGGIREIEFIVQSLQLVRGGSDPNLRGVGLQVILQRLNGHGGLDQETVDCLDRAYSFLRRLENYLQAIRDRQTHDLPPDATGRLRLALAMGYPDWASLERQVQDHRSAVSQCFTRVAFRTAGDATTEDSQSDRNERIAALWVSASSAGDWLPLLREMNLPQPQALAGTLSRFSQLPASRQVDTIARRRIIRLLPLLLSLLRESVKADVVLKRVLDIVSKIMRRSAYVSLLNENPLVLKRLLDLCATSAYLAEEISRFPLLLDEMLDPRLYSIEFDKEDMERDLRMRLAKFDGSDSEARIDALAQFQRAIRFRIAVADFSGDLSLMHVSDRLTELAELVLNAALQAAWRDLVSKHGEPQVLDNGIPRPAGFGVVAYGKLAGMEMSYSSDLDLVFLHDSHGSEQHTTGEKPLDNSMFFSRLVRRLVHFLTTQTSSGSLYEVDTRLRPSGRSGLLVTSIEAFERYQDENAWTWEHQALLRSRPVAGSAVVAREFERIRADTLRNRVRRDKLRADVAAMRAKMRNHLDHSDSEHFDLKQGDGGIGDIEFLVQYLVLRHAQQHPAVIHYPDNIRQLGTLAAAACLPEDEAGQLQMIYKDYRQRLHQLSLDGRGSLVGAGEFAQQRAQVCHICCRLMAG